MSDLADWLNQVPQLTKRAQEARDAYVRWLREQQQAAIDAHVVHHGRNYEGRLREGLGRIDA